MDTLIIVVVLFAIGLTLFFGGKYLRFTGDLCSYAGIAIIIHTAL